MNLKNVKSLKVDTGFWSKCRWHAKAPQRTTEGYVNKRTNAALKV